MFRLMTTLTCYIRKYKTERSDLKIINIITFDVSVKLFRKSVYSD